MNKNPVVFVLFGATGQLARSKILPALCDLWFDDILPPQFKLILVGRQKLNTQSYLDSLESAPDFPFKKNISFLQPEYIQVDFEHQNGFNPLWETLKNLKQYSIVYYMAVAADVLNLAVNRFEDYSSQTQMLGREAVILAEKPFGNSLADAQQLNKRLSNLFTYKYTYRNDHYLKKDTVQAIGVLIQSDIHLAQILNQDTLKEIELIVSEESDVATRAAYFDQAGMLVDWLQSHMLQMFATLCAQRDLENWQVAKSEFIDSLYPISGSIIRGQYHGYTELPQVKSNSPTETFLAVQMMSTSPLWNRTIFKFVAGKALAKKEVLFKLKFRNHHHMFGQELKLLIDPPGGNPLMQPSFRDDFEETILDAINQKQEKFVSAPEVESQWRVTQKVKDLIDAAPLQTYQAGTSYHDFCNTNHLWCDSD
jgi:glucose-6-phosphate 1-dehydrogenase